MTGAALWSATRQAAAIRAGELTSTALLEEQLARIDRLDPALNAVVTLDAPGARAEARRCDEEAAAGRLRGPLHGLPVTVKDAIEVAGLRSTGGSMALASHIPDRDAPAVGRLRAAGAVIIGKTNVPEWSGDIQTYNEVSGTTNNPWDPTRTPGGSSGGPAVAVATGMSSFELGTDIGGSIRFPAAFCGICGHKPSYGIVPQRGYLDSVGGGTTDADINVFGPLARSVEDLELLLDVLAGPLDEDAGAWRLELPPPRRGPWRVAVWDDDPTAPVAREVAAAVRAAGSALAEAGAQVGGDRPDLEMGEVTALFHALLVPALAPSFPAELADAIGGTHAAWLAHQRRRQVVRAVWARFFADHDALLAPVAPVVAFPHDHSGSGVADRTIDVDGSRQPMLSCLSWTGLAGLAGLPATVVPVARTASGMPVGVQVIGPSLEDRTSLAVARELLARSGGWQPPPGARD